MTSAPPIALACILVSLCAAILVPLRLGFWSRKHLEASWMMMLAGALTWVMWTQVLEKLLHTVVLGRLDLVHHRILLIFYIILSAAIFEEVGRFITLRWILPLRRDWKDGVAFGIGHGGIESIFIGTLSFVPAVLIGFSANPIGVGFSVPLTNGVLNAMHNTPWLFLIGGAERLMALPIHIALSVIVLLSIRNRAAHLLTLAIALHALFNLPAALYQTGTLPLWFTEGIILIMSILSLHFLYHSRKYFA